MNNFFDRNCGVFLGLEELLYFCMKTKKYLI